MTTANHDEVRAAIIVELDEAGRDLNRAVAAIAAATERAQRSVAAAKADGITDPLDLIALLAASAEARPIAMQIAKDTTAAP
jgi:hypothetical protein